MSQIPWPPREWHSLQSLERLYQQYFVSFGFCFYWNIISFQWCIRFCCTTSWISHIYNIYTYIPSLLRFPPTSTPHPTVLEHRVELPVLHSDIPLALLHMVMYMLQCYSLDLSHPLPSLLCLQVCPLCLCLYSCPVNRFISTIFLDSMHAHLVTHSCPTLWDPMDFNPLDSSVHGFPRKDYWRGLPLPLPRNLPHPGIDLALTVSPALQANSSIYMH